MIRINQLYKAYGQKVLFNNVSLTINRGEKIGFIGPNGAGKSTLFNLIINEFKNPTGLIQFNRNIKIGYLPQEATFSSSLTVLKELLQENEIFSDLLKEKEILETNGKVNTIEYANLISSLEEKGYFTFEHKAKEILFGLGFRESDLQKQVNALSGGFRMRLLLAKLLLGKYDILLLDEPTNYLDLTASVWLKNFLKDFEGTFVIISHDRGFLDEVTNSTLILEDANLIKFKGNYQDYLKIREQKRNFLIKQAKEQEKKIKQLQRFIERFHAHPNKASQVRAKKRQLEKITPIEVPEDIKESIQDFEFPKTKQSGYVVIKLQNVTKSYDKTIVYKNLNLEITRGERIALVGPNGAGKSTLLKILAGVTSIDEGKRILGYNVTVGYFSQINQELLNPENTVLEEALVGTQNVTEKTARTILALFLFRGEDVYKKVSVLSGGEKSRLLLAKLLINPPNFLLLDEPTTHLDVDATEALIKALKAYEGTIVFISHNIYFTNAIANLIYHINPQQEATDRIIKIPGDFNYYLQIKDKLNEFKSTKIDTSLYKPNASYLLQEKATNKSVNKEIAKIITKLRKEKEKLEIDMYVKKRILSNPHSPHSKEVLKEYETQLEKIQEKINLIEAKIRELKNLH